MKAMLIWWLFSCLTAAGTLALYNYGVFTSLFDKDTTKISFLIMGLYVAYSVLIGLHTKNPTVKSERAIDIGYFAAETMVALGLLGTVLGFVYMLSDSFAQMDVSDLTTLQDALTGMALGMSTALYTTATGLVCSLLLKVQLVNLEGEI
jgi:hypothetical protein